MSGIYTFCGNCGAEYVTAEDRYCRTCGAARQASAPPSVVPHATGDSSPLTPKKSKLRLISSDIFSDTRLPRLRFFLYLVTLWYGGLVVLLVIPLIYQGGGGHVDVALAALTGIWFVIALLATFRFARRRFHDMGDSGWWGLALLVPLINLVIWFNLLFAKGTDGPNEYGPKPGRLRVVSGQLVESRPGLGRRGHTPGRRVRRGGRTRS